MGVIIDNPRQERLAQNLAAGMTKKDAMIDAGYAPSTTIDPGNIIKEKILERTQELLEQRANTHVPGAIADLNERKSRLTAIVRHDIEQPVSAGHVIAAARELSLLDGSYNTLPTDRQVIQILVTDKETAMMLNRTSDRLASRLHPDAPQGENKPIDSESNDNTKEGENNAI